MFQLYKGESHKKRLQKQEFVFSLQRKTPFIHMPKDDTRNCIKNDIGHIRNGPVAYQTVKAKIDGHLCRILLDT